MRRPEWFCLALFAVLSLRVATTATLAQKVSSATDAEIRAEIERKIAGLKLGSTRVTVSVHDHVVVLDGILPTLWLKRQVIDGDYRAS
jgi:hypothetical protein